jgi:hypothetical protein
MVWDNPDETIAAIRFLGEEGNACGFRLLKWGYISGRLTSSKNSLSGPCPSSFKSGNRRMTLVKQNTSSTIELKSSFIGTSIWLWLSIVVALLAITSIISLFVKVSMLD